ncbi:SUMF1/EgtB/PvdO family nonheme iron enzyme [Myxococcota bacterium]|nr:SUMF1/EgtB/PvdO family nonheme iron enzyme [Myxococcota bacterium]
MARDARHLIQPALVTALAGGAALVLGACVEARDPPGLPGQVEVAYGPKVFLVDSTVGSIPRAEWCTRLAEPKTGTSTLTDTVVATDGVRNTDGSLRPIDPAAPHNCYVTVTPGRLRVDQVEVTNELFQMCVDSGVCARPDPSKASKAQVCTSEDLFDRCPVVEVTQTQAETFCKFIGRRLPTNLEHLVFRQANATDSQDPTTIPVLPNGKNEDDPPALCSEGVVGSAGCSRPQPVTPGATPNDTKGAALGDAVTGETGQIYDLIGNASEWSSDLLPAIRGLATGLPWFCQAPVPPVAIGETPACPEGQTCVRGQYQPAGLPLGDYPVCIAFPEYRAISGLHGSLFGGSFADNKTDREHLGTFGRRVEQSPDEEPAKSYGFRCVGDVGVDDRIKP